MRRIECQTGVGAYDLLKAREAEINELTEILKASRGDLTAKARKLMTQLKEKEQELEKLRTRLATNQGTDEGVRSRTIHGVTVHSQRVEGLEVRELRAIADTLRNKLKSGVILLGSTKDDKASLLLVCTPDVAKRFPAGELIKPLAIEVGGTGGGRPEMAQAGGKNPQGLDAAMEKVFTLVEERGAG